MISGCLKAVSQSLKNPALSYRINLFFLSMHQLFCIRNFSAKSLTDCLMSQTDPQHGDSLPHDLSDRRHKVARLFRDSGARREEYPVVIAEFFEVDPVVELYRNIHRFGRFPKQLYGVVDERVVIIDYQYLFHGYKSNLFYTFAE